MRLLGLDALYLPEYGAYDFLVLAYKTEVSYYCLTSSFLILQLTLAACVNALSNL